MNNNVFLLRKYIPYEDDSVVGIFSSRYSAEQAVEKDKQKGYSNWMADKHEYIIDEYEVDRVK
jgi:hypothetical protein